MASFVSAYLGEMKRIFWVLYILVVFQGCSPASEVSEVRIYVAASLSPALTTLAKDFEQQHNCSILINTASSGTLARQIAQGAPADLFISANKKWLTSLQNDSLILTESTLSIKNELVLIAPTNAKLRNVDLSQVKAMNELLATRRIAIGDPNHVPVGQYAVQAINVLKWQVSTAQTLQSKDARATLATVELGEAELGIVYRTDAEKSSNVKIIGPIPKASHAPINYFAGTCSHNPLSVEFLKFLNTPQATQIWKKYGFVL